MNSPSSFSLPSLLFTDFSINGYKVFVNPYKKIYLLLKNNKEKEIKKHIRKIKEIYNKFFKKMKLKTYLKEYIKVFEYFDKALFYKKKLKNSFERNEVSEIHKNFVYFFVSIDNFVTAFSMPREPKTFAKKSEKEFDSLSFLDSSYFLDKIKTIYISSYFKDIYTHTIFPVILKNKENSISLTLFIKYIDPYENVIKMLCEYLYNDFLKEISKKDMSSHFFYDLTKLSKIFSYIKRTQHTLFHFPIKKVCFIEKYYIENVFKTLYILLKNNLDLSPEITFFDISKLTLFYRYVKEFDEYFIEIYNRESDRRERSERSEPSDRSEYNEPSDRSEYNEPSDRRERRKNINTYNILLHKVFQEKIEIDYKEYTKEYIKDIFVNRFEKFVKEPFKMGEFTSHILESTLCILNFIPTLLKNSDICDVTKIIEKNVIIYYLNLYKKYSDETNYINNELMIVSIDFLITKYKEILKEIKKEVPNGVGRAEQSSVSTKLYEYVKRYKKEMRELKEEII